MPAISHAAGALVALIVCTSPSLTAALPSDRCGRSRSTSLLELPQKLLTLGWLCQMAAAVRCSSVPRTQRIPTTA